MILIRIEVRENEMSVTVKIGTINGYAELHESHVVIYLCKYVDV